MTLKLSDAMALGFTLVKFDPDRWLAHDGSCGCALGGAIEAAGKRGDFIRQVPGGADCEWVADTRTIHELWPWLTPEHIERISKLAWDIRDGDATQEQLLTYVRSIEPQEDVWASIAEKLPDISLEEQHRLEEIDVERESIDA